MSEQVLVHYKGIMESKLVWVAILQVVIGVLVGFGLTTPDAWSEERVQAVAGSLFTVTGLIVGIFRIFYTNKLLKFGDTLPSAPEKKV